MQQNLNKREIDLSFCKGTEAVPQRGGHTAALWVVAWFLSALSLAVQESTHCMQITNNKEMSNMVSTADILTSDFHSRCVYVQRAPCNRRGQPAENGIWQNEANAVLLAIKAQAARLLPLLLVKCSKFNSTWQFCKAERRDSQRCLWIRCYPFTVYVHTANGPELFKPVWSGFPTR